MRRATSANLLELWERAERCDPQQRALLLLAWSLPDHDLETLAELDLGQRDWHLLRLRRAMFGSQLVGHTDCPNCGERLEIELDARQLQDGELPLPEPPQYECADGRRFRLPNSGDLIAISGMEDVDHAARELFSRCSLSDTGTGLETDAPDIEKGLAALAADRAFRLDLACVACNERWLFDFDPAGFVWEEIRARALELLDEVDQLASAYGWSEADILAQSEVRRAAYLSRAN